MQDGFSHMEQSSEKTSELCSQVDCSSGQDGVKGQDERQRTAPLTPPRPLQENPCRKSLDWGRRCHTRKLRLARLDPGSPPVNCPPLTAACACSSVSKRQWEFVSKVFASPLHESGPVRSANSCFLLADVKWLPWRIGRMSLRYMEVELRREPSDIVDWVRYARFGLRNRLPTLGTPSRDGDTVLVISHLHHW